MDFVDHIKIDEIKNAYRRKALETHPDRARYFNVSELEMSERFKEINLAYEKLSAFTMSNSSLFHHNE
ncbi:MAG: DnaJ domain-containing protein, partial [Spirochaetota bacterium]|nr:DnaJ domain-containing protein [Spirochaetota bacterium]